MTPISRGFGGRRRPDVDPARVPPGQYVTQDFPVLTYGPTPRTAVEQWDLRLEGALDAPRTWTWEEFLALPQEDVTADIHCVTKWSKLDTSWTGVSLDVLLDGVETEAEHLVAWSDGGYTTNLPVSEVRGGRAWVVHRFGGEPLERQHGGPVRMIVPHLYFWKSAKWLRGISLREVDEPGFWEVNGYNNHGDPWREERYQGD